MLYQLRPLTNACMKAKKKLETVTIRIDPDVKIAIEQEAERENHSFSSLVGLVLKRYAETLSKTRK